MSEQELIGLALKARKMAYTPYSNFQVGAALLCEDGTVYTGCNIENAAYTPSNCAERTAIFKAVSEGRTKFSKIAVVGGKDTDTDLNYCAPCGVCRQVMMEFVNPDTFQVILGKTEEEFQVLTLSELLPKGFGPGNLA